MANPQKENGYTPIANEILEQLAKARLNGTQFGIILIIWRYTYGFSRKECSISESFLAEAVGIEKSHISREIKPLFDRNILIAVRKATFNEPTLIAFNKNYDEWKLKPKRVTVPEIGNPDNSVTVTELGNTTVADLGNQDKQDIKQKESLSSQPPSAAADGERVLTASAKDYATEGNNEIGRAADAQTEVLEVHADAEATKSTVKKSSRKLKNRYIYPHDHKYYIAAKWLADRIESRYPDYKKHDESTLQKWADSARLMFEKDNRNQAVANRLLLYSQNDGFWMKNILSMPKFREKYDDLLARCQGSETVKRNSTPTETGYINLTEMVARGES